MSVCSSVNARHEFLPPCSISCKGVQCSQPVYSEQLCVALLSSTELNGALGGPGGAPAIGWEHCVISVSSGAPTPRLPASTSADQAAETPAVHQSGGNAIIMPHICASFKEIRGYIQASLVAQHKHASQPARYWHVSQLVTGTSCC